MIFDDAVSQGEYYFFRVEKDDIQLGRKAEMNFSLQGRYILISTEIEVNNCFVISYY